MPRKKERKGYFYETEENAIVRYINEEDEAEREKIFRDVIYPALSKMVESIIRRYRLFIPDEDFEQNFNDTISYLLMKINHFRPLITSYDLIDNREEIENCNFHLMTTEEMRIKSRNATDDDPEYVVVYPDTPKKATRYYRKKTHRYKAYSYCGTVCKNYLMFKSSQYCRNKEKTTSYDEIYKDLSNDMKFSTTSAERDAAAAGMVDTIAAEIERMVKNPEEYMLTESEMKVGTALIDLLRNWEEVLPNGGSNKLQKSSVLYFLREETMMTTKELRKNMKKYKTAYGLLKDSEMSFSE